MSLLESTSIEEEIVDLANILADTQNRLLQVVARLEARENATENWETREEQLQTSLKEAMNSAKWLRAQNADLEEKLEHHRPELDHALSAREGAFRKLKHARKVIRDLLQERGDMGSPSQGSLTQEEIEQALDDDLQHSVDSSSSSSSSSGADSDQTVRVATALSSPAHTSSPDVQLTPLLIPVTSSDNVISEHPTPSESFRSSETLPVVHVQSPSRLQSPSSNRTSPETWHIHFKNPPGSSALQEGPITWTRLESSLHLNEDSMNSLQSLSTSPDLSMRLQITRLPTKPANVAFLYDPIFVETRHKSYILDWGRQQTNQNIERYISRHKGIDLVFHVFTFPPNENNWFYIGAHNWSVVQLQDFWPLEGKSKRKMILKLCKRSRGEVDEAEMARLLDSGELKQFCVELTRVRDPKISHEFAADVLGRPYSEPRHERRTEGVRE